MLTALDRVVVLVSDLETATDDYARLLGRHPSIRSRDGALGLESAVFRVANTALQVSTPVSAGALTAALEEHLERQGEGVYGLAFAADDVDAAVGMLRGRGLEVGDPRSVEADAGAERAPRRCRAAPLAPAAGRGIAISILEDGSDEPLPAAPVDVDRPGAAVRGLDHVVIHTADADAARRLYGDGLGLRLALDRTFEARGLRILFFRVGGATVEVVAALKEGGGGPSVGDRFGGLAWQVPDVPQTRARLAREGFLVSEERAGHKPGTRVCTVKSDTHGVATLLIGPDAG